MTMPPGKIILGALIVLVAPDVPLHVITPVWLQTTPLVAVKLPLMVMTAVPATVTKLPPVIVRFLKDGVLLNVYVVKVVVLITISSAADGIPLGVQLAAVPQLPLFQVFVAIF
jgi:hypothetical protein